MIKRLMCSVTAGLLILGSSAVVSAGTIQVSTTLDVAAIVPGLNGFTGGVQNAPPFTPTYSEDLAVGDFFEFTIDFGGGQLTIENLSFIWAFSYSGGPVLDVEGRGSLALLDSSGAPIYTSNVKTSTEGVVHFGQQFYAADFPTLPSSVTFGGLRYYGEVLAYLDPGTNDPNPTISRTYNEPALYFNAQSFTTASVPDAGASLALFGMALTALAAAHHRMRN